MTTFVGTVRFPDGLTKFVLYDGSVDCMRPRLFNDRDQVQAAWDDPQEDVLRRDGPAIDDELLEVMPYSDGRPGAEVMFRSYGNRKAMRVTGPLCTEESMNEDLWPT